MFAGLAEAGVAQALALDLALGLVGWAQFAQTAGTGAFVAFFSHFQPLVSKTLTPHPIPVTVWLGLGSWALGWFALAQGIHFVPASAGEKSAAAGAPLHPKIAEFKDFYWGTLAAYGFGIFLAELVLLGLYLALVGTSGARPGEAPTGLSHLTAFLVAFAVSLSVAVAGGFLGAANARRLSVPEATVAVLYFGLPLPIVLTLMTRVPQVMLAIGYRLREVAYLSAQLGETRPELGYWLVYLALALAMILGLCLGFVATSSGRLDLRTSYERFVSGRHVDVFRPRLLLGVLAVLLLGIAAPVLLFLILRATGRVVERTRIRHLGLRDPLEASSALHALKAKEPSSTSLMTNISIAGVGVGVMALIIVLSVMSGFEQDLQKKILGTNSHGLVLKYGDAMPEFREVMEKIKDVPGLVGQTPFVHNEVMVASDGNISGALIKGIEPESIGSVTDLPANIKDIKGRGELEWLNHPEDIRREESVLLDRRGMNEPKPDDKAAGESGAATAWPSQLERKSGLEDDPMIEKPKEGTKAVVLPGIILGNEMAASLRVRLGDRVNVVSPVGGELGPQGPMPKSRAFKVAAIFHSGMFEYDSKVVYIHLSEAMSFFNMKGATGLELKFKNVDDARRLTRAIYDLLEGYPYRTRDWGEMNKNLFAALRLEKLVMAIILSVMVIVAGMLIVATMIMLVLEKRKEIAVLKALGVSDGGVVKIFLLEGLQIGVAGGLLGLVAGLGWCLFIDKFGINLDPQVYYIPSLPVRIEPFQTGLAVVIAVLVTFLASIFPALTASQVEPVEGLKAE